MHLIILASILGAAAVIAGCQAPPTARSGAEPARPSGSADSAGAHAAVLTVHGMGCPQCANNVDLQLMKVPGVESVAIDMGSGRVLARLEPGRHPSREALAQAIANTGFTLVDIEMPR